MTVISLKERREKKNEESREKSLEVKDPGYDFEEAARQAKLKKEREEKDRLKANKNVLRSYNIKKY